MNTKHTPGPWEYQEILNSKHIEESNAKLRVAASVMLEALQQIMKLSDDTSVSKIKDKIYITAQVAIKKATE